MATPNNSTNQKHRQHWRDHSHQDNRTPSPDTVTKVTVTTVFIRQSPNHQVVLGHTAVKGTTCMETQRHRDQRKGQDADNTQLNMKAKHIVGCCFLAKAGAKPGWMPVTDSASPQCMHA